MRHFLRASVFFLCALLSFHLLAQDRTVSGRVVSADDGSGLPGVNVVIKGSATGTVTDSNGAFSLAITSRDTRLVFSFIGMQSQEIQVGEQSVINVTLGIDVTQLAEVVVTGYGATEKRSIGGAISSVKGEAIQNLPVQSLDRALQGRAAGVMVQSNNGIPGGAVNVRIRGTGSINAGNAPLYVVDGVQINTRSDANFTQSNPLAFLNASDIQSIEVLKDAASAAIYGSQAANGVVLITTKKGKAGKAKFTMNAFWGASKPLQILEVLDAKGWFDTRRDAYLNSFTGTTGYNASGSAYFTLREMGLLPTGMGTALSVAAANALTEADLQLGRFDDGSIQTYDWQRETFKRGNVKNYELSVSGGDAKTTFFLSGSFNHQEAISKPVDFKRGTLKLNLSHQATEKLTIETNLNLSSFNQQTPFALNGNFLGSPQFASSTILPHNPIYNEDGSFNLAIAGVLSQNPISVINFNSGYNRTNQVVGNLALNYKILSNLTFRSFWGLDYRLVQGERYTDPRTPDGTGVQGRLSSESEWNTNFISTQTLNYSGKIGTRHSITALAGLEFRSDIQEGIFATGITFPSFEFRTLNSAATPEAIGGFWTGFKRLGAFGQVNYDLDKKYILTLTGRYDGSSRFGSENLYGFFPSVQVAWRIKDEGFLKDVEAISDLKLRSSYGQAGNDQIGNFDARGLWGGGGNYANTAGIRPQSLANTTLGWERNETINVGLDLGLFNNRIAITGDYFIRNSKDLLLVQPTPWLSGYDAITSNVGEMQNKGIEVELNTVNLDAHGLKWTSSFNFTYIQNEVQSLYGGLQELPGRTDIRVGESFGSIFVQRYAGVNAATGRPMWYDINGNITYQPLAADRVVAGDTQPDYFGGFSNTISYKRFELSFLMQYEYGRYSTDGQVGFLRENATRLTLNALQETSDARWTTPGQVTWIPRPVIGGTEVRGAGVNAGTANWYYADYIRLKQVSLTYTLAPKLISKWGLSGANVYVQGVNLWTYSDYLGYDPEWVDAANGIIPQSKSLTAGIQLQF